MTRVFSLCKARSDLCGIVGACFIVLLAVRHTRREPKRPEPKWHQPKWHRILPWNVCHPPLSSIELDGFAGGAGPVHQQASRSGGVSRRWQLGHILFPVCSVRSIAHDHACRFVYSPSRCWIWLFLAIVVLLQAQHVLSPIHAEFTVETETIQTSLRCALPWKQLHETLNHAFSAFRVFVICILAFGQEHQI